MDNRMPAGRGGGTGPVRKVSGTAPKSFVRGGGRVPGASGPRLINNISRSNSSAVSGAGTVPAPPRSISTHKIATVNGIAAANERTFSDKAKTSCLFCIDPVIVAMREGGSTADNPAYISQLVKNLCDHMQLDHQQLPNEFTRIKFPFCDSCIEPIVELLECQKIIDDANARITTALATIETIVAEAEILNVDSSMQPMSSSAALMDQQRFSKLRIMILEVIRKKLIMQKNLRKSFTAQGQASENVENMTTNVNPTDIDATTAEESALQVGNDRESVQDDEDWRSDRDQNFSAHEDSPLPPDAQDDENSGIPVILSVRGGPSIAKQGTSRASPDGNDIEIIESNDSKTTHPQKRKQALAKKQKKITSAPLVARKTTIFSCPSCKKQFVDLQALRVHKKTHMVPLSQCDICGRMVKGWLKNMMTHKFSHKNDEERRVAIADGEIGANKTRLSNKLFTPMFRNKIQNHVSKPRKYKPRGKKEVSAVASSTEFSCRICSRKFGKQCYLSIHMKTHRSASNSKPPKLRKQLHTEPPVETASSSQSSVMPELDMDFVEPPGSNLEDVVIEENDEMVDDSSDEEYGYEEPHEENEQIQ